MASSSSTQYDGQNEIEDQTHDYNTHDFQIRQALSSISTATLVKIVKVSNSGTVDKIGTVDVLPLVNMMNGAGDVTKHVTIEQIPYMRNVAGSKGIIMDPKVGDIGVVVFADRDIQSVRKAKGQASPGSRRRFSMADGVYLTSVLADAPTSYIQFGDDGSITLSPDNGTTNVKVAANDIKAWIGSDFIELTPGKAKMHASGAEVICTGGVVKLYSEAANDPVMLQSGPSTKIFGVL